MQWDEGYVAMLSSSPAGGQAFRANDVSVHPPRACLQAKVK
jgi:hypothetical protein